VFRNACQGDFVFDDAYAVVQNPDVYSAAPWWSLWSHDFWGFPLASDLSHKSYRPLTTLSFRLQMILCGDRADAHTAAMMHVLNVVLHAVNSGLLTVTYLRVFHLHAWEAVTAGVLFACHPVHVEAVASIVGRAELLAGLLLLLCLLTYRHFTEAPRSSFGASLGLLLGVLALLCKETAAVAALPLCSVLELLDLLQISSSLGPRGKRSDSNTSSNNDSNNDNDNSSSSSSSSNNTNNNNNNCGKWSAAKWAQGCRRVLAPLLLLMCVLALRLALHGGSQARPFLHPESNPGAFASLRRTRVLTLHYYLSRHLTLLVYPWPLCCDWSYSSIPLVEDLGDPRAVFALLVIYGLPGAALAAAALQAARSIAFKWPPPEGLVLSVCLLALTLLPASNLLFPVGFAIAERVLYLPSMGSCALIAMCLGRFQRAAEVGCLKLRSGVALARGADEALWHAQRAVEINPGYWHGRATLGQLQSAAGNHSDAAESYSEALLLAERQGLDDVADAPKVRLNLAVMLQDSQPLLAERHFQRLAASQGAGAIKATALVVFGAFLESQGRGPGQPQAPGRLQEAAEIYREALLSPGLSSCESVAHLRLGSVLRRLSRQGASAAEQAPPSTRSSAQSAPPRSLNNNTSNNKSNNNNKSNKKSNKNNNNNNYNNKQSLPERSSCASSTSTSSTPQQQQQQQEQQEQQQQQQQQQEQQQQQQQQQLPWHAASSSTSASTFAAQEQLPWRAESPLQTWSRYCRGFWAPAAPKWRRRASEMDLVQLPVAVEQQSAGNSNNKYNNNNNKHKYNNKYNDNNNNNDNDNNNSRDKKWSKLPGFAQVTELLGSAWACAKLVLGASALGRSQHAQAKSTWPPVPSEEAALLHSRLGLQLASLPTGQSLDPGARKWKEALAVVGARLVSAGRIQEAAAVLAPLRPRNPAAALLVAGGERMTAGDTRSALDAYKAAAALEENAEAHLGIAAALKLLGDEAGSAKHRQRAAQLAPQRRAQPEVRGKKTSGGAET
ncbi:unnamed protein product, partial [Polarella glacialis]